MHARDCPWPRQPRCAPRRSPCADHTHGHALVAGASHMSFTNICSLPPAQTVPQLKEIWVKPGLIDQDKGLAATNALAVAWLNR